LRASIGAKRKEEVLVKKIGRKGEAVKLNAPKLKEGYNNKGGEKFSSIGLKS